MGRTNKETCDGLAVIVCNLCITFVAYNFTLYRLDSHPLTGVCWWLWFTPTYLYVLMTLTVGGTISAEFSILQSSKNLLYKLTALFCNIPCSMTCKVFKCHRTHYKCKHITILIRVVTLLKHSLATTYLLSSMKHRYVSQLSNNTRYTIHLIPSTWHWYQSINYYYAKRQQV